MICKDNQEMIDNLLRLKVDNDSDNDNNKIASIMSESHDNRIKKDNETLCVSLINEIMDAHRNQNKIASTQTAWGELAEFQSLLKGLT